MDKNPFKVQDKSVDSNVTDEKFIDRTLDSILQLTLKLPLEFWYELKENIHSYLRRSWNTIPICNHICVWDQIFFRDFN